MQSPQSLLLLFEQHSGLSRYPLSAASIISIAPILKQFNSPAKARDRHPS